MHQLRNYVDLKYEVFEIAVNSHHFNFRGLWHNAVKVKALVVVYRQGMLWLQFWHSHHPWSKKGSLWLGPCSAKGHICADCWLYGDCYLRESYLITTPYTSTHARTLLPTLRYWHYSSRYHTVLYSRVQYTEWIPSGEVDRLSYRPVTASLRPQGLHNKYYNCISRQLNMQPVPLTSSNVSRLLEEHEAANSDG